MNPFRKLKQLYILLLLLLAATGSRAADDAPLRAAIAQLKNADGYSYDIMILSWLPDKKQADTTKMNNYQSRTEGVVYARSGEDIFFLCSKGQFRVDAASKTVYYHAITDTAELAELKRDWHDPAGSGMVDSFFLAKAQLRSRKKEGKKIRYELQYPESMVIRQASFRYDTEQKCFDQISYTMERPLALPGAAATIRQQVIMGNYCKRRPRELAGILQQQQQLKTYLEQTYKDYTIQTF